MARLSTYGVDAKPSLGDKVIGTDTSAGANFATKNYSLYEVMQMFNELNALAVADQALFFFQTDMSEGRDAGTVSLASGGGVGSAFASVTELMISKSAGGGKNVTNWLKLFIKGDVILAEAGNINNFGTYHVVSVVEHATETDFYVVTLSNLASNGVMALDAHYIFSDFADPNKTGDLHFVHNQISASSSWTITHNLGKHPTVSIVDSGGNWVVGDIVYTSTNELTINFTATFSGKAYLN